MNTSSFIGREISRIAIECGLPESILHDYVAKNHVEIDRCGWLIWLWAEEEEDLEKMNELDAAAQKSIDILMSKNMGMNTSKLMRALHNIYKLNAFA